MLRDAFLDRVAPKSGRKSIAFHGVAARLPVRSPALPRTSAPVQTEVTNCSCCLVADEGERCLVGQKCVHTAAAGDTQDIDVRGVCKGRVERRTRPGAERAG